MDLELSDEQVWIEESLGTLLVTQLKVHAYSLGSARIRSAMMSR